MNIVKELYNYFRSFRVNKFNKEVQYLKDCKESYKRCDEYINNQNDFTLSYVNDLNKRIFELEKRYANILIHELYELQETGKDCFLTNEEIEGYLDELKDVRNYEGFYNV